VLLNKGCPLNEDRILWREPFYEYYDEDKKFVATWYDENDYGVDRRELNLKEYNQMHIKKYYNKNHLFVDEYNATELKKGIVQKDKTGYWPTNDAVASSLSLAAHIIWMFVSRYFIQERGGTTNRDKKEFRRLIRLGTNYIASSLRWRRASTER
jgi:hypothetical protein